MIKNDDLTPDMRELLRNIDSRNRADLYAEAKRQQEAFARWPIENDVEVRALKPKPTVPGVLPLVRAYYAKPGNGASGSLHIVLDDGNLGDVHVQFCLDLATERGDMDGANLAVLLLQMSKTQRGKLARLKR